MNNDNEEALNYPKEIVKLLNDERFCGRMNDPTSASYLKGPCGDEMEFYLIIKNNKIVEAKCFTRGCDATRACGAMAAKSVCGKTVNEALSISAGEIIKKLKGLPESHLHCSILAVSALYRAIADYLLKL